MAHTKQGLMRGLCDAAQSEELQLPASCPEDFPMAGIILIVIIQNTDTGYYNNNSTFFFFFK